MSLEEEKSDIYWEGVRDTLRLIRDFNEWQTVNPQSDRTLQSFLEEAQTKIAGRVNPKLVDILGVPFK